MAIGAILGGLGAATSIAGGLFGGKKAKKAAKKQKRLAEAIQKEAVLASEAALKQFGIEQNIQAQQARLTRIESIREARMRRAQIIQSASTAGAGLGSLIGAGGALTSQFLGQQSTFNLFERLGQQSAEQQKLQLESQGRAAALGGQIQIQEAKAQQGLATGQLISGIGESIFQVGNRFEGFFTPTVTGVK